MALKSGKDGASSKLAVGNSAPAWKGLYRGEGLRATGSPYKVDSGAHYLPGPGFETTTKDVGEWSYFTGREDEHFLEIPGLVVKSGPHGYVSVPKAALGGKSVALLFSASKHPKCTNFVPFLKQFYKNVNEAGERAKIEIIFVSVDETTEEFEESRHLMPWLCADYNSALRTEMITRYNIKAYFPDRSDGRFLGKGIPRLVVVGPRGEPIHWLPCDHQSPTVLREWDIYSSKWPDISMPAKPISKNPGEEKEAQDSFTAAAPSAYGTGWARVQKLS